MFRVMLIAVLLTVPVACSGDSVPSSAQAALPDHALAANLVGTWYAENGELAYRVFRRSEGTIVLELPPIKPWRREVENVHIQNGAVCFDEYYYASPRDDYKSITNPSGEHPFSGVRCEVVLTLDPHDANRLLCRVTLKDLPDGSTSILVRRSKPAG